MINLLIFLLRFYDVLLVGLAGSFILAVIWSAASWLAGLITYVQD
jgi:hypothetical protein